MPIRQATIASSVGLHARPASLFVAEAAKQGVPVTIQVGDKPPVDARSMLAVMTLGAKHGDVVTLSSDAEGADAALDALAAFLEIDHDAPTA
ncbi:MAG: HPr family phosphocarrier protein [Arachnia sp.]